jgi:cell cycle protein kinase DBF2
MSGLPIKLPTTNATSPPSPSKQISGLPQPNSYYRDIHMDTAKGLTSMQDFGDIRMATAKGHLLHDDIRMETARGATTLKQGGFQVWERELLESSEVKRKATVAQLCKSNINFTDDINFLHWIPIYLDFLDYYFQTLGYIAARKDRRSKFDQDTAARDLKAVEYAKEFKSYCGRERVILRRRRTKLKVDQFHIIAQVGQGGYGEVYLARKQETGEVCALKKMKKRTLFKMDEVFISFVSYKCD